jgi:hypothetical protein
MPKAEGESEQDRDYKKTYYVTLKRLDNSREFFLKVLKLQPRFMAVFGPETESIFKQLNMAHVHVQVSAQSLMRPEPVNGATRNKKRRTQMEADVWRRVMARFTRKMNCRREIGSKLSLMGLKMGLSKFAGP